MGDDPRALMGLIVIVAGAGMVAASYAAAWMFGRQAGERGALRDGEDVAARLRRIEVAVEAIAIEVERQGEGQRSLLRTVRPLEAERGRSSQLPLPENRAPT